MTPPRLHKEEGWLDLGPVEAIPLGQGRCYRIESHHVAVFRLRDGTLRALGARCPHRGGLLADGITDPEKVLCPLHGFAFSLATGEGVGHSSRVPGYEVRSGWGQLLLRIPASPTAEQSIEPIQRFLDGTRVAHHRCARPTKPLESGVIATEEKS